jgi:predicted nucleic-acid-binding protein
MIAVDTNVLLRRVLDDDPAQTTKAKQFFERAGSVLITDVVLVETIWTLRGKRYGATRDDIAHLVMSLFEEPNVIFEDTEAVWAAYSDYIDAKPVQTNSGTKWADFSDALIATKATLVAKARTDDFRGTYSFDQGAQALPNVFAP